MAKNRKKIMHLMPSRPYVQGRMVAKIRVGNGHWKWTGSNPKARGHRTSPQMTFGPREARFAITIRRVAAWLWMDFDLDSNLQVNHVCDEPLCLKPTHLYIGTQADNVRDSVLAGTHHRPSKGLTKLTPEQVQNILVLKQQGVYMEKICKMYEVSAPTIRKAIRRYG